MKAPIHISRTATLTAGSALLATGLIVLSPITAQDQPSSAAPPTTPAPTVAPAPALPSDPTVSASPSATAVPLPTPASTPVPATPAPVKPSAGGGAASTMLTPPAPIGGLSGAVSSDRLVEYAPEELTPPTITTVRARLAPGANTIPGSDVRPRATTIAVADLILTEEVSGNADEMSRHYEAVVADFDSRRAGAAQAIFRLGESYRKAGRIDEARIQYSRILREFVDFPEIAILSQRQLTQGLPRQFVGGGGSASTMGSPRTTAGGAQDHAESARAAAHAAEEERSLLLQEIQLLQSQVAQTEDMIAAGQASSTATMPLLREILQLKRQLVRTATPEAPTKVESTDPSGGGAPTHIDEFFTSPTPEVPRAQEVPSR